MNQKTDLSTGLCEREGARRLDQYADEVGTGIKNPILRWDFLLSEREGARTLIQYADEVGAGKKKRPDFVIRSQ